MQTRQPTTEHSANDKTRANYIAEFSLAELRGELAKLSTPDARRSATSLAILLLLLDLPDAQRVMILAMLRGIYFPAH